MIKYLIDVNLPFHFSHWNGEEYVHQRQINAQMQDKDIWEYAMNKGLTIVTKDADFADKMVNNEPPPRVVHFKIGNMKLNTFHDFVSKHWQTIKSLSEQYKLVNVYFDRIEGID